MEDKNVKFISLSKQYEKLKGEIKLVQKELSDSMKELKEGTYVQDPETLAVYKIVKPNGHFVFYKELDYERTILGDEKRGTLSKKEAEEHGFVLKK